MKTARGGGAARRILIYGVTGSGKTTLAARLSAVSRIGWHSVDDFSWKPGWVTVPAAEQRCRIKAICQQPEWILNTASGAWPGSTSTRINPRHPDGRPWLLETLDWPGEGDRRAPAGGLRPRCRRPGASVTRDPGNTPSNRQLPLTAVAGS